MFLIGLNFSGATIFSQPELEKLLLTKQTKHRKSLNDEKAIKLSTEGLITTDFVITMLKQQS